MQMSHSLGHGHDHGHGQEFMELSDKVVKVLQAHAGYRGKVITTGGAGRVFQERATGRLWVRRGSLDGTLVPCSEVDLPAPAPAPAPSPAHTRKRKSARATRDLEAEAEAESDAGVEVQEGEVEVQVPEVDMYMEYEVLQEAQEGAGACAGVRRVVKAALFALRAYMRYLGMELYDTDSRLLYRGTAGPGMTGAILTGTWFGKQCMRYAPYVLQGQGQGHGGGGGGGSGSGSGSGSRPRPGAVYFLKYSVPTPEQEVEEEEEEVRVRAPVRVPVPVREVVTLCEVRPFDWSSIVVTPAVFATLPGSRVLDPEDAHDYTFVHEMKGRGMRPAPVPGVTSQGRFAYDWTYNICLDADGILQLWYGVVWRTRARAPDHSYSFADLDAKAAAPQLQPFLYIRAVSVDDDYREREDEEDDLYSAWYPGHPDYDYDDDDDDDHNENPGGAGGGGGGGGGSGSAGAGGAGGDGVSVAAMQRAERARKRARA